MMVQRQSFFLKTDIQSVQDELSPKVLTLAPDPNEKIPYLTTQEGLGNRMIIGSHNSPICGKVEVEDLDVGGTMYRRMIFEAYINRRRLIYLEILI